MSLGYSRANPSTRYQELLSQYKRMHTEGERFQNIPAEHTFSGQSLPRHCEAIKQLIDQFAARTILDYGSGKGMQYRECKVTASDGRVFTSIPAYWAVDKVVCYDPGYEPFSRLPSAQCDGVVCTDVLEHCPEEDLDWILAELFGFARKFVYANIAGYPAQKRLSNGENAHCTIRPREWWQRRIDWNARAFGDVRYSITLDVLEDTPSGKKILRSELIQG
jgi:hypothetical protein